MLTVFALATLMVRGGMLPTTAQVIPLPLHQETTEGLFTIRKDIKVYTNLRQRDRRDLQEYLRTLPIRIYTTSNAAKADLRLEITPIASVHPEAYELAVTTAGIAIKANTSAGIFYALQTVVQLAEAGKGSVPCGRITDEPRFSYRGMMLDVSRHFFGKAFVLRQLDMIARYKLNTFHLHLHDTGGWRIQLKSHPELTMSAAYRNRIEWDDWGKEGATFCARQDSSAYGGYYTKQDIRDILHYAAVRHITVIPEIDLPGHCSDVLFANPGLACEGTDWHHSTELCIGKEATFRFCEEVLGEIIDLFPSRFIHIGGDECSTLRWAKCADCQRRMREEGIDNVTKLQSYFTTRMERFVQSRDRRIIGWDEILDGTPSEEAVIMSWRPQSGSAIRALTNCHDIIMAPSHNTYFDSYQAARETQPKAMNRDVPLANAYNWDPAPDSLPRLDHVLGVQCCLWTEFITSSNHAEYMLYPRLMALAEVAWATQGHRHYNDFVQRAIRQETILRKMGFACYTITEDDCK